MKALVFGDLQATEGHEKTFENPALSLQRWRVQKFYEDALKLYRREKCDAIWDLGDTTDDRTAIPIITLDAVIAGFSRFPRSDFNIKLIGNHEQYVRSTELHAGKVFSSNFRVVDSVQEIELAHDAVVLACAYPPADSAVSDWLVDRLRQHRGRKVILLGHFQVAGCQLNSGTSLTGVPKSSLDGVSLGLLGHIHKFQEVASNVFYVGSPFQQDFGEAGDRKVVGIVDTRSLTVTWHSFEDFPKYHEVDLASFINLVDENSEDRFRVVIRNYDEAERFYAHPLSVRADPIYDYKSKASTTKPGPGGSVPGWTRDLEKALDVYVEQVPPDSRGVLIDRRELLQAGLDIVEGIADPKGD